MCFVVSKRACLGEATVTIEGCHLPLTEPPSRPVGSAVSTRGALALASLMEIATPGDTWTTRNLSIAQNAFATQVARMGWEHRHNEQAK